MSSGQFVNPFSLRKKNAKTERKDGELIAAAATGVGARFHLLL